MTHDEFIDLVVETMMLDMRTDIPVTLSVGGADITGTLEEFDAMISEDWRMHPERKAEFYARRAKMKQGPPETPCP